MDRIFESYNGTGGFSADFMRKTRERLHWICSQVKGRAVLDVACSQGIGPILLGRMGFEVTGVDINSEAIAFAKGQLEKETENVRRKVSFVTDDFLTYEPVHGVRFDSVVMGEVLEHLIVPESFIVKAHAVMSERGSLVVTVPFGINDDPDHRQTFYLSNVYLLVAPWFEVVEVRFFNGWIGMVCTRRAERLAEPPSTLPVSLVSQSEAAFNSLERPLVDARTRANTLTRQLVEERKKTAELEGKVALLESTAQKTDVVVVEDRIQELKTSLAVERQTSAGQVEQIALLKAALQLASSQKGDAVSETRLLEYSQEVKDLRASLDAKGAELITRAERCGRFEAECATSRARVTALENELAGLRHEIAEQGGLAERYKGDCDSVREHLATSRARVTALENELAGLRHEIAEQSGLAERYKGDCDSVREHLATAEAELTEKTKAVLDLKTKCAIEAKAHQESVRKLESAVADSARRLKDEMAWSVQHRQEVEKLNAVMKSRQAELEKAKTAIAGLEREKQMSLRELAALRRRIAVSERAYDKLAKAKLGRLTLAYWRFKDGRKKNKRAVSEEK